MKKNLLGMSLAIAGLAASANAAGVDVQDQVSSLECQALKAGDPAITVSYDKANKMMNVTENGKTVSYQVFKMTPGLDGLVVVNGYSAETGRLQMNVYSGATTMLMQGSKVDYVSCTLQ